jgi:multidrug resistance efflux pump
VSVKQDEPVKAGQVLAEQDVTVEKANKATYEIEANSAVEEEYAIADVELKKVELARKESLFGKSKAINQLEVDEARLNVKRAEASVKLAQQKRATAAAQAAVEQAKIDLKRIVSPIDGIVQKLDTHPGEVASNQAEKPAIKIVKNDPLWIDVNFPAATAHKLKDGQPLQVRYRTTGTTAAAGDNWLKAEVLSLQPIVRPGSQVRTVRLVMPNPDHVAPGLEVDVKLPDATVADAGAAREPQAGGER